MNGKQKTSKERKVEEEPKRGEGNVNKKKGPIKR